MPPPPSSPSHLSSLSNHINPTNNHHQYLQNLLQSARPFLRGDLAAVDDNLPPLLSVLQAAGAGECWHKHGSFLHHLLDVYRILKIWKAPQPICLCGLFHSAYSNSYVNLAIFPPSADGREVVRSHVGAAAEDLIHLFCVVPRQQLIHDLLLFKYTDEELVEHLRSSEIDLGKIRNGEIEGGGGGGGEWRKKLESVCPAEGITLKHIKTGEDVVVSRRLVAVFLLLTMADFSDQLFGFQDELFENSNGRLEFSGNNVAAALWPGEGKPGLWMNSVSRMGAIYMLIAREEEILRLTGQENHAGDEELDLVSLFNYYFKYILPNLKPIT